MDSLNEIKELYNDSWRSVRSARLEMSETIETLIDRMNENDFDPFFEDD